jgi:hypothetical protein
MESNDKQTAAVSGSDAPTCSDSWKLKSWRPMIQDYKWTRRLSNDELLRLGYEGRVYALALSVYHFQKYNTLTIILKIGKIDLKWRIERKISNQNAKSAGTDASEKTL